MEKRNQQSKTKGLNNVEGGGWYLVCSSSCGKVGLKGGGGGGAVPSVVVPPQCSRLFFQFQVLEGASTSTVESRMGSEPNKVHPDLRIMAAAQKEWLGPGIVGIIAAKKEKSQIQIRSIDDGTPI